MKKEVLLVTILVIIVSLSAVVYAAALTNPGHGVEEVGSGSSPYAPFRDWNVFAAGYEDQYSGPSALKSNIFWLATSNAETIAAQNSSGDWCAFQVHPSGIYMNCVNNASNMSLFNSYYWNGTNFTKNDTIKNGSNVIEKKVLTVGPSGATETTEYSGSLGTLNTVSGSNPTPSLITIASNAAGTSVSTLTITSAVTKLENTDTGESATVTADGGGGVTLIGTNGAGDTGEVEIGDTGVTATGDLGGAEVFNFALGTNGVDAGSATFTIGDTVAAGDVVTVTAGTDAGNNGLFDFTVTDSTLANDAGMTVDGDGGVGGSGSTTLKGATIDEESGYDFIVITGAVSDVIPSAASGDPAGSSDGFIVTDWTSLGACVVTDENFVSGVGVTYAAAAVGGGLCPGAFRSYLFYIRKNK